MRATLSRWIGAAVSLAVISSVAAVFATPAGATSLHGLTPAGCISDVNFPENCGGVNGGPNETQGLFGVFGVAASPDGKSVYVVGGVDDAIVRFNRAPDGTLTPAGCFEDAGAPSTGCGTEVPGLDGATGVAVSPDGLSVYVVSPNDGAIVRFNRAADGSLTPAGCFEDVAAPAAGCAPAGIQGLDLAFDVAISPDGTSVYVAGTGDDSVAHFSRAPDGALTSQGCISDIDNAELCGGAPGGANEAQGLGDAGGVAVSPDGSSVYVVSFTDAAVVRFNRAPDGSLTAAGCIDDVGVPATCGAGNEANGLTSALRVAVSPDGASVYVTAENEDSLVRFNRASNGALTSAGCFEDVGAPDTGCGPGNEVAGLDSASGVAVSPDGESVYVPSSSTGDGAIVHFSRASHGALTPLGCFDDAGGAPVCGAGNETLGLDQGEAVVVSPNGASVYVGTAGDSAIVHFDREVPPVCLNTAASGPPDAQVTVPLDCFDPNGDPLSIELLDAPLHGTLGVVDQVADTVVYTPATGFSGGDAFSYRAVADNKPSNVAGANLVIVPPQGVPGPTGPQGPAGEPAIKLLALLASDRFTALSGAKLPVRFATSAGGSAEIELKKRNRVLISRELNFSGDGAHKTSLKLATRSSRARGGGGKPKPLKPGNYTIALTVTGDDGQVAKDSARLRVRRP